MSKSDELGSVGEAYTTAQIRKTALYLQGSKVLRNVYIPNGYLQTEEADIVLITRKGILVFENKNYSGWIFGNENDLKWTQILHSKRFRFNNPVEQNKTHIKWLKKFLGIDVFCYSVIVFSQRCTLKKITVDTGNTLIIKSDQLVDALDRLEQKLPDRLTGERIEWIYKKLFQHSGSNVDEAKKREHIESISRKYKQ